MSRSRWWNKPRFDALEVCLLCALVVATAVAALRSVPPGLTYSEFVAAQEADGLKERYGPGRYSEHEEEWVIRDYFKDRRDGYFVDVGANHYKNKSNTYYLEAHLGWSGLAIDPQEAFAADYGKYRPRTRFFPFFVSDTSDATVAFYLADKNPLVASGDRRFTELFVESAKKVTVPTIRLTDLLDHVGVTRFDLLSVDVELAEPKVLAGFDVDRFKPSLVCIEAHPRVRQQILDYFAEHRYVGLGRYLRADIQNLYFAPLHAEVGKTGPK